MNVTDNPFPYLHGFSPEEQKRLHRQAQFAEHDIYRDIDFSSQQQILEVGCGVGAQTEILLRRFPKLNVIGIDLNDRQLKTAKDYLSTFSHYEGRYEIKKMNADNLDFDSDQFDGAFLCWILEHVPEPLRVLSEVRRVLKPGSKVYVTEVMNSTFFLDPYSPNLWKYWMAFSDYQYDGAGDPFIGAKLGNLLTTIGFRRVQTNIITWHFDNRQPEKRKEIIDFWLELLLSAADQLISSQYVTEEIVEAASHEMKSVRKDPNAVFMYSFMQAEATVMGD